MLIFEPFSVSALKKVMPYIKRNKSLCSDLTAGYLFMWDNNGDTKFCVWNDTFVIRQKIGEQPAFSWPIGDNVDAMIIELQKYVYDNHLPLRFFAIDEEMLNEIKSKKQLQPICFSYQRKWSDYIYLFEEALSFKGKKYNGQRNHINKFIKLYGNPQIRFLTNNDKEYINQMLSEYVLEHTDMNALEHLELLKTKELFNVHKALSLYSAGLFIDDKLIAFSIGEVIGESLFIHVEKALKVYSGAYPTMYSGFVNLINNELKYKLKYINREDDSGNPGLRTSKMQYHPISIANKYLVHIDSPMARYNQNLVFSNNNVVITKIRESDKKEYLDLNIDINNNKYWGYDYREDITITNAINENTFYDSVMYDMCAGDSINFAIRLEERGEMIGEAILWNFTSDGSCELGCRILPKYQGKGYGKSAFRVVADLASQYLNLLVHARCYNNNTASYKMIMASGFVLKDRDKDFCYFEQNKEKDIEPILNKYLSVAN